MPRSKYRRRIAGPPGCHLFKPAGIPTSDRDEVLLQLDELEAIRLADLEGFYQDPAAELMRVSRQTFGRIVTSARRKVARALVEGKILRIEGGAIEMDAMRTFRCSDCQHKWEIPYGTERPQECAECKSQNIHRVEGEWEAAGPGGGRRQRGNLVEAKQEASGVGPGRGRQGRRAVAEQGAPGPGRGRGRRGRGRG